MLSQSTWGGNRTGSNHFRAYVTGIGRTCGYEETQYPVRCFLRTLRLPRWTGVFAGNKITETHGWVGLMIPIVAACTRCNASPGRVGCGRSGAMLINRVPPSIWGRVGFESMFNSVGNIFGFMQRQRHGPLAWGRLICSGKLEWLVVKGC